MLTLVLIVVATALVFEYINGFHDTANSIATVVATKVLSPMQAVGLAASMNLIGALMGTAVAKTISSGLIDAGVIGQSADFRAQLKTQSTVVVTRPCDSISWSGVPRIAHTHSSAPLRHA